MATATMPASHATTMRRFRRVQLTVFAILGVSYLLVFFHRVAPAVVAGELMQEFNTTAVALGSLASMYYYTYTAMQIPAGILADTLGVRLATGIAMIVAGVGSVMFGLAPDFTTAAIGRLLVGLGVSVVFVGLMRANTVWWSEAHFGFISGITILLGNIGAILAAGPLAAVLTVVSWQTVFVALGGFNVAIAVLTFIFVRNRPEDANLPSLREMQGGTAAAVQARPWWLNLRDVLRDLAVWPGFWINFGMTGSLLAFSGLWGVPLLRDVYGLDRAEASLYTTLTLATLAIGSLGLGWLSDHLRLRKPVAVGCTFASAAVWLACVTLPWGPGLSGFILYGLIGFCAGGFIVTFGAAKEVVPPAMAGMAMALINTGVFLGAAVIQPTFGWLLDLTWDGAITDGMRQYSSSDYANGLWLCFAVTVVSAIASLRLRETRCRNIAG